MNETGYKKHITDRLEELFPGCVILRGDSSYNQGIPDIFILWNSFWAALEFKIHPRARIQANQEYYVNRLNDMSFAAFIHPGNEEDILYALEQAFKTSRRTRISKS